MDEHYNNHYISIDAQGCIVDGWSDGPFPNKDTTNAICINEEGGYQFRLVPNGEENPSLYTRNMIPLYKLVDGQIKQRTTEEIEAEQIVISQSVPVATTMERLEAQVAYTAMMTDTLLEV